MPDSTPPQFSPRQWEAHVQHLISAGSGGQPLIDKMVSGGWPEEEARSLVRRIASKERQKAAWTLIGCTVLALVALAVSIGSYEDASRRGGMYFFWYGGVIVGVMGAIYGLVKLLKIRA